MGICTIPQEQIYNSTTPKDDLTVADALTAQTLEDDLNYIRSAIKSMHGGTTWHDVSGGANVQDLDTRVTSLETYSSNYGIRISDIENDYGADDGLATLVGGKVPQSQLPATTVTSVSAVLTIAERDALTGVMEGDVVVVTDDPTMSNNGSYIYDGTNWQKMASQYSTTDEVNEGVTNLYYTDTRVQTYLDDNLSISGDVTLVNTGLATLQIDSSDSTVDERVLLGTTTTGAGVFANETSDTYGFYRYSGAVRHATLQGSITGDDIRLASKLAVGSTTFAPQKTVDVLQASATGTDGVTIRSGLDTTKAAGHLWSSSSSFVIDSRKGNLTGNANMYIQTGGTTRISIGGTGNITLKNNTHVSGTLTSTSNTSVGGDLSVTGDVSINGNDAWHNGNNVLNSNSRGYLTLANGFILQWGRQSGSGSGCSEFTFPLTWTNGCLQMVATSADTNTTQVNLTAVATSTTKFKICNFHDQSYVSWIAIGH